MDKKPCCKDWASSDPNPDPPSSGRRDIRGSRSGRHTSLSSMRGGRMTLALSALRCGLVTRSTSEKRNRYTSNCRRKRQGQSTLLGSGDLGVGEGLVWDPGSLAEQKDKGRAMECYCWEGFALVPLLICRQGRGLPQGHTNNWCAGKIKTTSLCPAHHTFSHCCLVCVVCVSYVRDRVGVYTSVPMSKREQDARLLL